MVAPDAPNTIAMPLPWQQEQWRQLSAAIELDKLPHAIMAAGPSGTGKRQFAQALARRLLCHSPVEGVSCGHCKGCELSRSGAHGDFRWLQPEEGSRQVKIDQVRSAIEFTTRTASYGQRKVLVISPAEAMNVSAANALLKSLEEPSSDTHILLVCDRPQGLPATVRSRCQQLWFPVPPASESFQWLSERCGNDELARRLLEATGDRPLTAYDLFSEGDAESLLGQQAVLEALGQAQVTVEQLRDALSGVDAEALLSLMADQVQATLRSHSATTLRSSNGQRAFELLDELQRTLQGLRRGANPNRDILGDALLVRFGEVLGGLPRDGRISATTGDVGP